MTLLLGAAFMVVRCSGKPQWRGTAVVPAVIIPSFAFKDSAGKDVSTAPAMGSATLVFFGYTNCPDVCPTTLADWTRVKKALGADAKRVRFVFVTVDPQRDSPDVAARFATQFDSAFVGLSGDSATTANIQKAFGVASTREKSTSAEGYLVTHSAQVFLVDDRGQMVVTYGYGAGWDAITADIKSLLR